CVPPSEATHPEIGCNMELIWRLQPGEYEQAVWNLIDRMINERQLLSLGKGWGNAVGPGNFHRSKISLEGPCPLFSIELTDVSAPYEAKRLIDEIFGRIAATGVNPSSLGSFLNRRDYCLKELVHDPQRGLLFLFNCA